MSILSSSDFNSSYHRLSKSNFNKGSIQELINLNELGYLSQILGVELAGLLMDDLDSSNVPVTQRFIDIFNPFIEQYNSVSYPNISSFYYYDNKCCIYESRGIKYALEGLLYYDFVSPENIDSTDSGVSIAKLENGSPVINSNLVRVAEKRYNGAIESIEAIQKYICENSDVYPEYNGCIFKYRYSSIF